MLQERRARIVSMVALLFVLSTAAFGQAFGRVVLTVVDGEGNPLRDVSVIVTSEGTSFRQEKTTNKKGKTTVSVTDGTKTYQFHVEHSAYPSVDLDIKPTLGDTTMREVTLSKGQAVAPSATGAPTGALVYTAAERVFNDGVNALKSGDTATAKANFLEAVGKDSRLSLAHSALASVYLQEDSFQEALGSAQRFLELEPNNPLGLRMVYQAYTGLGNTDEAEKILKELKKVGGDDTGTIIYNEGVEATKVGDYKTAKSRFTEALELKPDLTPAVRALAIIHFNEGESAKAVEMAERMLQVTPDDQKMLRVRYDGYIRLGDEVKAKEAMTALAKVDPQVLISEFYNAGVKYFESGDLDNAKLEFKKVLDIDPSYPRAHFQLGISHVSSGESALAKTHLQKFIELAPEDPEVQTAKDMLGYLN